MIGHMILQNALHRPVRTAITVIAVAVEVTLVIIVVGLTMRVTGSPLAAFVATGALLVAFWRFAFAHHSR